MSRFRPKSGNYVLAFCLAALEAHYQVDTDGPQMLRLLEEARALVAAPRWG